MRSTTTTAGHGIQELHALLYNDDINAWVQQNKQSMHLAPWVRDNILHVIDACPNVLFHWQWEKSDVAADIIMHRYIAAALETLDDDAKVAILSGDGEGKAQTGLLRFIKKKASYWSALSPSWIGPPGSALRAMAVQHGWTQAHLPAQVYHSLERPASQRWCRWVSYAYTLSTMELGRRLQYEKDSHRAQGPEVYEFENAGQAWTSPEDMALACAFAKRTMGAWNCTLQVHPDARLVPPELQERMDALVQVYVGMNMLAQLKRAIMAGDIPAEPVQEPSLVLPVLDTVPSGY